MDPAGAPLAEPPSPAEVPERPDRRSRYLAAGWALALSILTTIGLFILTWMLLLMHALGYGVDIVIGAGISSPDDSPYALAFATAAALDVSVAVLVGWFAGDTPIRHWAPSAKGLAATVVAAAPATCSLLLILGIVPAQ